MPETLEPEIAPHFAQEHAMATKFQQLMAGVTPEPDPGVNPAPPAVVAPATPPAPPKPVEPPKPPSLVPVEPAKPKNAEEKKAYDFATLKKSQEEWQGKATSFEKDLAAARAEVEKFKTAKPAADPEKDQLRKERDEYQRIVKQVQLKSDPAFRDHYQKATEDALTLARSSVPAEMAGQIETILKSSEGAVRDAKVEEILDGLGTLAKARLTRAVETLDTLRREQEHWLSKSDEALEQMVQHEKQKQERSNVESEQRRNQLSDVILQQAVQFDSFKVIEGNDAHNETVKTNQKFVQDFIHGRLPQNIVPMVPVLASEALYLREKVLPGLREENARLIEQIKGMVAATPAPGGGGGVEGGVPEIIDKSNPQAALSSFIGHFERLGKGG